jgi:hypothetical protein
VGKLRSNRGADNPFQSEISSHLDRLASAPLAACYFAPGITGDATSLIASMLNRLVLAIRDNRSDRRYVEISFLWAAVGRELSEPDEARLRELSPEAPIVRQTFWSEIANAALSDPDADTLVVRAAVPAAIISDFLDWSIDSISSHSSMPSHLLSVVIVDTSGGGRKTPVHGRRCRRKR